MIYDKRRNNMRGRIIEIGEKAKLEIWETPEEIGRNMDEGGYCHICEKYIYSIHELIEHFFDVHGGGK